RATAAAAWCPAPATPPGGSGRCGGRPDRQSPGLQARASTFLVTCSRSRWSGGHDKGNARPCPHEAVRVGEAAVIVLRACTPHSRGPHGGRPPGPAHPPAGCRALKLMSNPTVYATAIAMNADAAAPSRPWGGTVLPGGHASPVRSSPHHWRLPRDVAPCRSTNACAKL